MQQLQQQDVNLRFEIPFAVDIQETSKHLASWLTEESTGPTFSVVGFISSSVFTGLLSEAFTQQLSRDVSLLVLITSHLFIGGSRTKLGHYTARDLELVRNYIATRLLLEINSLLKPSKVKAMQGDPEKLRAIFLLAFSVTIGVGYAMATVSDNLGYNAVNHQLTCIGRNS